MSRLAIIDYGGGNLGSLLAALDRRGVPVVVTENPEEIDRAEAAMLPGDGAFASTMDALRTRGLDRAITRFIECGRPFFGICVGMQILYERSDEHGDHAGLGVLPGAIGRLRAPRVPHMGWDELTVNGSHPALTGVGEGDFVYFLHSYRAPVDRFTIASCTYGEPFAAVVARDNVIATQFHPEKSQRVGATILDNWLHGLSRSPRSR